MPSQRYYRLKKSEHAVYAFELPHLETTKTGFIASTEPVLEKTRLSRFLFPIKEVKRKHLSGWRAGARIATVVVFIVLMFNVTATIAFTRIYPLEGDSVTILHGSCQSVQDLNKWIHLIINLTSTILLGFSNYCTQSIIAPTINELVEMHNRKHWLHIGVQSLRNLRYIAWERRLLWGLLFASSVPLHLLFNSAVFPTMQANEYIVLPATQSFWDGGDFDSSWVNGLHINGTYSVSSISHDMTSIRDDFRQNMTFQNYSTDDCFKAYDGQFVSEVGNVVLIQDTISWYSPSNWTADFKNASHRVWIEESNPRYDYIAYYSAPSALQSNGWSCPSRTTDNCRLDEPAEFTNISSWEPFGGKIRYCLVEQAEQVCQLQFSLIIAISVIACNAIKLLCMAYIVLRCKGTYLVTLGDTIAAFLENPDPETIGRCLYSRKLFYQEWNCMQTRGIEDPKDVEMEPEIYAPRRYRWAGAARKMRWFMTYSLALAALATGIFYSVNAQLVSATRISSFKQIWTAISDHESNNLLDSSMSVIQGTILANVPQALLSYLYLMINGLLTCMLVGNEWTSYYLKRKPLRVSSPAGQQRSTYWLQVPFRYSVPLFIASFLLHWLASQSLYMVLIQVTRSNHTERQVSRVISTLGFSPEAIILTTVLAGIILLGVSLMAWRRYPAGMPLAGSCSAIISAACHPPESDINPSKYPVQWGAVGSDRSRDLDDRESYVSHCSFTSGEVTAPVEGRLYA